MDPITDGSQIIDGMQITYIKEDSGQIIPGKIWLVPGEVLTVGKDIPAEFATRLVEDNVCRVISPNSSSEAKAALKAAPSGEEPAGAEAGN